MNKDRSKTIIESWERSKKYKVSPNLSHVPLTLSADAIQNIQEKNSLYHSFETVYNRMEKELDDKYALGLADHEGRMIGVRMKGKLYDQLGSINFYPGGDWHETNAGTNAIGTALVTEKTVTIKSSDHYCSAWQSFSCAGAPIRHPLKGNILGVLDLTCSSEYFHNNSSLLTIAMVEGIQAEILFNIHHKHQVLRRKFVQNVQRIEHDWLLLIDLEGEIIEQNHLKQPFDYVWKSSFDWINYVLKWKGRENNRWHECPLPFLHGHPQGKVQPVSENHQVIGFIVQLPKKTTIQKRESLFSSREKSQYFDGVIGKGKEFQSLLQKVEKIASSNIPVLLTGESGTGKEVISRHIHRLSTKKKQPFIAFNCSSLNHELAASELFGYAPGSFTGGLKEGKKGLFETADGGVLFLDEIGDLPLSIQPMLLRVLQEKEVVRIGEYKPRKINVRLITATNKDLMKMIEEGSFREDLYYRLSVVNLVIPPLRDRKDDIELLIKYFLQLNESNVDMAFSQEAIEILKQYHWPGNIRELKNVVDYAVLFVEKGQNRIDVDHLPDYLQKIPPQLPTNQVEETVHHETKNERELIIKMLKKTNYNLTKAAKMIGFSRGTLYNRLKKYDISY